ncbi:MAG: serine/threonine-protein kinase [Mariprofundaceae bacterium]
MRCASCGVENPGDGGGFCANCGAAIGPVSGALGRLGQYVLDEKIGEGGMGIVYRAHDEKLGREVAIKVLHPHLLKHENLKERFRREARMHAKLIHPNIVTLLSLYEDKEHMALVMEMVRGINLREWLRKRQGRLRLGEILAIADAILAGLEAAHTLGVVHRDLKPANVLITDDGQVKLMDFGLAKPEHDPRKDLTHSGAIVGSFRYMAPEQILGEPVDARTDLYAFGILLYEMCTGRVPFDASGKGSEFVIMEQQVRKMPEPPSRYQPKIPPALESLIMHLLAKKPEDRPPSATAVRTTLQRIRHMLSQRAIADVRMRMPPPGKKMSNWEIAKGLVLALLRKLGLGRS